MRRTSLIGFIWLVLAGTIATAAEYPDRPIRLIVPQAAGSASDNVARLLSEPLGKELKQPIVIDYRPGNAFATGLDAVAKSTPDGYTIGLGTLGALGIMPHMAVKLPYDNEHDFQPVAQVTRGQLLLAVSPQLPVHSVKELIAFAKENPGKLSNASSTNGSPGHVGGELFKFMTGTNIVHVPYRGGAQAIEDMTAGRVDVMFEGLQSIAPFAQAGKVRGLAVTGTTRSALFPDLPTVAEAGVPGYSVPTWIGVIAPAGVPRGIVVRLNQAINKAMQSEAFKAAYARTGDEPGGGTPEEFAATIKADSAKWGAVVKRTGVKLD